jgi:FdhD protein
VKGEDGAESPLARVHRSRWTAAAREPSDDFVVREEPLEIRLGAVPVAVVMRTPGHDEDLARGFLVTERIVTHARQIRGVRHCAVVETPEAEDNVILVELAPEVVVDLDRLRRNLYASSSCGICGKATIENVLASAPPLCDGLRMSAEAIYALPARMRSAQAVFDRTGGLHAAAVATPDGTIRAVREDVGRHNAVDKVIGWAIGCDRPLGGHALMVSGRVSYEIVQKALAARIPLVAGVSAPSSLAIELARASRMTLVGFLRDRAMSVYASEERISS